MISCLSDRISSRGGRPRRRRRIRLSFLDMPGKAWPLNGRRCFRKSPKLFPGRNAVHIGIDVGSISVKFGLVALPSDPPLPEVTRSAFLGADPVTLSGGARAYLLSYDRLMGDPNRKVPARLAEWSDRIGAGRIRGVTVTGKSGAHLAQALGFRYENDFRCLVRGVTALHDDVRTIFEMGGENAKVIRLERSGGEGPLRIRDYDPNGDCAAGTGSFIDQQAHRMKLVVEEIGEMVARAGSTARIAGRCSVFAKTDMIHAQQKGNSPEEILKGLCEAVARNFKSSINKGKDPVPRVALVGGLFANQGVVRAVCDSFGFSPEDVVLPRGQAFFLSPGLPAEGERSFPSWPPLSTGNVVFLRDRVGEVPSLEGRPELFLGIDVGSVSTNFALLDGEGNLLKEIYVSTQGRPVQVVKEGLRDLREEFGERIRIRGVGTTGSGRELIGELVGADTVQDEITAHKTGSSFISRRFFGQSVDTIFEIGGQDSKFISLENGVVVDFAINDACAAGAGSFLEEQAGG